MNHGVLERFEEILLELEVRQLVLLEETHSELTKSIESEEGDVGVVVAADLIRNEGRKGSDVETQRDETKVRDEKRNEPG